MVLTTPAVGDADDGTSPVSMKGMDMAKLEPRGRARRVARLGVSLAVLGLLAASLGVTTVSAAGGPGQHATFTKWITEWPSMAGVVGGKVGDGAFAGTVIDYAPGPTTLITAIYHFDGSRHDIHGPDARRADGSPGGHRRRDHRRLGEGQARDRRVHPDHLPARADEPRTASGARSTRSAD